MRQRFGGWWLAMGLMAAVFPAAEHLHAEVHLWVIHQVFSNADGSVQYIEFRNASNNEQFTANHPVHATRNNGQDTNTFVIPDDLPSANTAGRSFLLATGPVAGVMPDFVIPQNFIHINFETNARVHFPAAPGASLIYTSIPTDGFRSLDGDGNIMEPATVRNFAGHTGTLEPPPSTRILELAGDLAFGDVSVGDSDQRTLTLSNSGNDTLTVNDIEFPEGFSGDWTSGSIDAGGSQPVTVTFAPESEGLFDGTITVDSDSTDGDNTIPVSGTGVAPGLDFGNTINLGGNWHFSPWMGFFYDAHLVESHQGWIYHAQHGWWWVVLNEGAEGGMFAFDEALGWLWTRDDLYPYLFSLEDGWLWYLEDSADPRWFYSFGLADWLEVE